MEPNFLDGVVAKIRAKNREDYEQVVFSAITDLRIWVQENAEKAALAFLAVGFLIPFLFQFLLLMLGLAALVGFVIWTVALPASGAARCEAVGKDACSPGYENSSSVIKESGSKPSHESAQSSGDSQSLGTESSGTASRSDVTGPH